MLPTCPACKQSVLDDDATECPFCGANMKTGKPGSKPAPAAASTSSSALDDDEDEDLFESSTPAAPTKSNAPRVSTKRTKTNSMPVTCPMCESAGFVPPSAAGHDVQCANPNCVMPVFTVPKAAPPPLPAKGSKAAAAAKKKAAAEEGPPAVPMSSSTRMTLLAVGSVAVVGIVGAVFFFWPSPKEDTKKDWNAMMQGGGAPPAANTQTPPVDNMPGDGNTSVALTPGDTNPAPSTEVQPVEVPAAPAFDQAAVLKKMTQTAVVEQRNRSKPFCRRLTAIAFATAGDYAGMAEQLQRLDQFGVKLPHYHINALAVKAWQQLEKGDTAGAEATVTQASEAATSIPRQGRDAQEVLIELSALLAATGKAKEARELLRDRYPHADDARLVARLVYSHASQEFRTDQPLPGNITSDVVGLPYVTVTLVLCVHGQAAAAKDWAINAPGLEIQAPCLRAWADLRLRQGLAANDQAVAAEGVALADTQQPPLKAQILARLGLTRLELGDKAAGEADIAAAQQIVEGLQAGPALHCGDFKAALDLNLPDPATTRQQILACIAVTRGLAELKQVDAAWELTLKTLDIARGMAPSPAATDVLNAETSRLGLAGTRSALLRQLNLSNEDQARQKAAELNRKLTAVTQAAQARFDLQVAALTEALEAGLGEKVWTEVLGLAQRESPEEREPYLDSPLASRLLLYFQAHGPAKLAEDVSASISPNAVNADPLAVFSSRLDQAWATGVDSALAVCNSVDSTIADSATLALVSRAVHQDQSVQAFDLSRGLKDLVLREEALRRVTALLAKHGQAGLAVQKIEEVNLSPTEKLSAYLGVVEGEKASH